LNQTLLEHAAKHTLGGHYAGFGRIEYRAARATFLADLRHFERNLSHG
jgi:hypothetical protein